MSRHAAQKATAASFGVAGVLLLLSGGFLAAQEGAQEQAGEQERACSVSFTPGAIPVAEKTEVTASFSEPIGDLLQVSVQKGSGLALDLESVLKAQARSGQPEVQTAEAEGDTVVVAEAYRQTEDLEPEKAEPERQPMPEAKVKTDLDVKDEPGKIEYVEAYKRAEDISAEQREPGEPVTFVLDAEEADAGEWMLRFTGQQGECSGKLTLNR